MARAAGWLLALVPLSGGGDSPLRARIDEAASARTDVPEAAAEPWAMRISLVLRDRAERADGGAEPRVRRLVSLGSAAIPAVVEALGSGRLPAVELDSPTDSIRLSDEERGVLHATLDFFGRRKTLPALEPACEPEATDEARRGALEALAVVGRAPDLPLAVHLAIPADPTTAQAQRLLARLEQTTEAIVGRDTGIRTVLPGLLRESPPAVACSLARGAAASGSPIVLDVLVEGLGIDDELSLMLLAQLGRAARHTPRPLDSLTLQPVRGFLSSDDLITRRAAILALAELGDPEVVDELIALLESDSPHLREASLLALRRFSGLTLDASPAPWTAWHAREKAWYSEHAGELFAELRSPYKSRVIAALNALAGHRFRREEIASHVAVALRNERADVRRLACSTLASLGATTCARDLVACLADTDPDVARAAGRALRAVSREDLPPDPAAWARALGLPE